MIIATKARMRVCFGGVTGVLIVEDAYQSLATASLAIPVKSESKSRRISTWSAISTLNLPLPTDSWVAAVLRVQLLTSTKTLTNCKRFRDGLARKA